MVQETPTPAAKVKAQHQTMTTTKVIPAVGRKIAKQMSWEGLWEIDQKEGEMLSALRKLIRSKKKKDLIPFQRFYTMQIPGLSQRIRF
jgi:hypothetical protein